MTSLLACDTGELHAVARRISRYADDVRDQAVAIAATSAEAHWYSPAATAFGRRAEELAAQMRRAADELDDAAAAMHRHAERVDGALGFARVELARGLRELGHAGRAVVGELTSVGAALVELSGL